jgi:hypothetical protein
MIITFTKTVSVDVDTDDPISFAELERMFKDVDDEATIQQDYCSGFIKDDEDLKNVYKTCSILL